MKEQIKYEPVFGDQSLFDGSPSAAVLAVGYGNGKVSHFSEHYRSEVVIFSTDTSIAMRRIIRTPTWTVADQKAGKLPEVLAKVDGGVVVFVNSFNVVTELESGAVIVSSPKTFLNTFKPIESPEEKAARLREEWVDSAITETEKRKDTTTDEYERLKARVKDIYDALLSGDLPVPVKGE